MNEHLRPETTDRGFNHMPPPIESTYGGVVQAYESSAASGPRIWLNVEAADGLAHLTAESAWRLAEQLMTLVRDHYQGDARPDARVADFLPELTVLDGEIVTMAGEIGPGVST